MLSMWDICPQLGSFTGSLVVIFTILYEFLYLSKRERKLYLNNPRTGKWSHVAFNHPATFRTLALDLKKKGDLMNDLHKFSQGKEYYSKIGKAWKRGYLLYGPPGTGKSTTIAAMANFLNYDVYDLELTTVKDNSDLKRLMIETSSKSIIVIEDIDCLLDLTSHRKKKEEEESDSKVTPSGLLNALNGIWSACGEERIIVFTTNFVDKLDPALLRKGRMDMHIELSYCCFEAFKVLAKNYLGIKSHHLFEKIRHLLEETDMTPADVAENLMPKSDIEDVELFEKIRHLLEETDMTPADIAENLMRKSDIEDVETCLKNLIKSLEMAKVEKEEKAKKQSARKDVEGEESSAKEAKESDFEDVKVN